jgi:hypothetical protein
MGVSWVAVGVHPASAWYVFGALQPLTGAALTWSAERCITATFGVFLEQVGAETDPAVQRW